MRAGYPPLSFATPGRPARDTTLTQAPGGLVGRAHGATPTDKIVETDKAVVLFETRVEAALNQYVRCGGSPNRTSLNGVMAQDIEERR